MGNDIEIRVRVANQTRPGFTVVNRSLQALRTNVSQAGRALDGLNARAVAAAAGISRLDSAVEGLNRSLRTLRGRAAAADSALRDFHGGTTAASTALRSLNTRMQAVDGRFDDLSIRTRSLAGDMDDFGGSADSAGAALAGLRGGLGRLSLAGAAAGEALGGGGGGRGGTGLKGQLIGVAAALGTSVLPAIGALAPMLTGLAVVGGGAALAMDDLKKKAKELKKPFEEWKKTAEKAVAPHTEKAVKSLKGAMKDLNPVIKIGAETFGRITEKAAKFADSPAFKSALAKNAQMGAKWVEEFAGSVGRFTQAFLDFGSKSQPALDAWQNLLGGMLDRGMPGMFKGLERGVGGTAQVLDGLAYAINDRILPAFGRFSGEFAKAAGPLFREGFKNLGDAASYGLDLLSTGLRVAAPLLKDLGHGLRAMREFASAVIPTLADVGSAIANAIVPGDVDKMRGPLERLADAIKRNKGAIQEGARQFGNAVISMTEFAISNLPIVVKSFDMMSTGVLGAIDVLVSGAAAAFGHLPLIGDEFKDANKSFDKFKDSFLAGMDSAQRKTEEFAAGTLPKLEQGRLKLNIDNWESQIATAKGQLDKVPPEKRSELKARIKDLQEKVDAAKRKLGEVKDKTAKVDANPKPFWDIVNQVKRARMPRKTSNVGANLGLFQSAVRRLNGAAVGTSYINVAYRAVNSAASAVKSLTPFFRAGGGPVRGYASGGEIQHFPNGGYIQGPGGPRSDSILASFASGAMAAVSNTEYVVQSSAVQKYGLPLLEALNEGRLKIAQLAKGGSVGKAARGARDEIRDATSGATETRLLKLMDAISKGHIKMATALSKVNTELSRAKDKLSDLKSAASQLRDSVKSGILSGANITRAATEEDSQVTINTLLSQMQGSAANASQFSKMLTSLKKRGLSKDLIAQIAEAGVEGGGMETAAAILGGGASEIKQLNKLQSQITKSAKSAGQTAADAMFKTQIKAQEKLVKALDRLADALRGVKKKAAGGPAGGLTVVGEEGPEMVRLPFGSMVYPAGQTRRMAWESMLAQPRATTPGPAARPAAGGPVSGQPIVLNVSIAGRDFGQLLVDVGRKEVETRGGVQATFGRL